MTEDPPDDPDENGGREPASEVEPGDRPTDGPPGDDRERPRGGEENDGRPPQDEPRDGGEADTADPDTVPSAADSVERARHGDREPDVSVTIEGKYDTVFERLEHPQALQHGELDAIVGNIESTLLAVVRSGGGIRSEIYDAVDFELEDPWEVRIYLEVLEMHDLIRLQDDRWVPTDPPDRAGDDGPSK